MFRIGRIISWVLLVVFFVALAAIAATFYESDREERAEVKNADILKKGGVVIDFVTNLSRSLSAPDSKEDISTGASLFMDNAKEISGETIKYIGNKADKIDISIASSVASSSDGAAIIDDLFDEGQEILEEGKKTFSSQDSSSWKDGLEGLKFWEYQKNDHGAEIILSSGSGQEYIIPLPFSFLSDKQ